MYIITAYFEDYAIRLEYSSTTSSFGSHVAILKHFVCILLIYLIISYIDIVNVIIGLPFESYQIK